MSTELNWWKFVDPAQDRILSAVNDLGPDLAGFSVMDLLLDNFPISSAEALEIIETLASRGSITCQEYLIRRARSSF